MAHQRLAHADEAALRTAGGAFWAWTWKVRAAVARRLARRRRCAAAQGCGKPVRDSGETSVASQHRAPQRGVADQMFFASGAGPNCAA